MVKKKRQLKAAASREPMTIRNIEDMGISVRPKDMLSRALEIYNKPVADYKVPVTLGKPKDNPAVMAMDKCIEGVFSVYSNEWRQLAMPKFLGYPLLSNIAQDPLIRAGIETIADDMTRKFINLTSKGDVDLSAKISELESDLQKFRVKSIFNQAISTCGYQGGCLVYIDVGPLDDDEKKTPLFLDSFTFKKGMLRGFKVIEPINIYPGIYDTLDPTSEDYFNPETWFILGKEYHKSRFLYFAQNEVPLILKPLYNFFGISLAQQVLEYVQNFTENRRSAQRLLNKFSMTVWRTDMSAFLNNGSCASLIERVKFANSQRSNDGMFLLDKEREELEQINTPLAGVTDIVSMSLDLAPVILGISKDKYFGDLPKGLNASSEGTNRIYYDKIHSLNEKISYDAVEKVLKILQLNLYGEIDPNISFEFAPLWEMDERERAEINKINADTAAIYVDRGSLSNTEVRGALADNPNSGYSNIDVDAVPETESFDDIDDEDKVGAVFDGAQDIRWITIGHEEETGKKGTHIPVEEGETNKEATERFLKSKGRTLKEETSEVSEVRTVQSNSHTYEKRKEEALKEYEKKRTDYEEAKRNIASLNEKISKESRLLTEEKIGKLTFENNKQYYAELRKNEDYLKAKYNIQDAQAQRKEAYNRQVAAEYAKNKVVAENNFYPENIDGIKRGKEMSFAEADGNSANPNYDVGSKEYSYNCQSCVVAYEARRRGYNIEANKYGTKGSKILSMAGKTAWINPETGEYAKDIIPDDYSMMEGKPYNAKKYSAFLDKTVKENQRYNLSVLWSGRGRNREGHVLTCSKDKDGLYLYDPQTSEIMRGKKIVDFLSEVKYSSKMGGMKSNLIPSLYRVDNMAFNPDYFDVMRKKNNDSR